MKDLKTQNYFNFKLTDDWGLQDFYIYEESTADGYSIYIATHDINNICVNENVYYKVRGLKDALIDHIIDGSSLNETIIYVDDLDAYYIEEAINELKHLMEERIKETKRYLQWRNSN